MTTMIDLDVSAPNSTTPTQPKAPWRIAAAAGIILAGAVVWASWQKPPTPEPTPLTPVVVDVVPAEDGNGSGCLLQIGDRTWYEHTDRLVCEWRLPLGGGDPELVP